MLKKTKENEVISKTTLANTDIKLSKLGLGTVKFGRNTQVKYPQHFDIPNDNSILKILELCQQYGINTLDTAPAYGDSEIRLGKIFKSNNNNINRKDWVIITKAGEIFHNDQSSYNFNADFINTSINNSLKSLATDYIDILLIHSDGNDQEIANNIELWKILEHRKQQGDIKSYGVSSKTVNGGLECLKQSDLAMITYRQDYLDEKPLLDYALKNNKGIILKKALNSGHISAQNTAADCLRFSSSHPAVNSMIIGTINPDHLLSNINSLINTDEA